VLESTVAAGGQPSIGKEMVHTREPMSRNFNRVIKQLIKIREDTTSCLAGRRARYSLAVFVVDSLPRPKTPRKLCDQPTDNLISDLESNVILKAYLQCAGQEMPLSLEDGFYFGPRLCESRLSKDEYNSPPLHGPWTDMYHMQPQVPPFPVKHIA
jgi:hypothetical protein